jgi:hypothetical protein
MDPLIAVRTLVDCRAGFVRHMTDARRQERLITLSHNAIISDDHRTDLKTG